VSVLDATVCSKLVKK